MGGLGVHHLLCAGHQRCHTALVGESSTKWKRPYGCKYLLWMGAGRNFLHGRSLLGSLSWSDTGPATTKNTTSYIATATGPRVGTGDAITTASDSFITPTALVGMFANTAWTFNWNMRAGVAGCAGHLNMRVWASPDPHWPRFPRES